MTINELREKRNQAWNAAKAFVETKRDKDGLLSEEDAKTYAQMGALIVNAQGKLTPATVPAVATEVVVAYALDSAITDGFLRIVCA